MEKERLERSDPPFTPLMMFTCTYEAQFENIHRSHEELSIFLAPHVAASTGAVKALNSNFIHVCQPGYERFLKQPKPPRVKIRGRSGKPDPAMPILRKRQGDATCFNSAIEVTIIPSDADDPPPSMRSQMTQRVQKIYSLKSFPSTGQTQVPGVICSDLADGPFIAGLWADFLTKMQIGIDPTKPVLLTKHRPIMVNFKFQLNTQNSRSMLMLTQLVTLLENVKETNSAPFPIREIKHPQDGQNLSFKCACTTDGIVKKIRVNVFFRGKVNILGACDFKNPQIIYDFLSKFISDNWDICVGLQPRPDFDCQPDCQPVVPAESLTDDDLTALLDLCGFQSET